MEIHEKMKYEIEYHSGEERHHLIEYVGEEPCTYNCRSGMCWRDCVPCCFCEASEKVIPDKEKWDAWREKYRNRKSIPCSKKHTQYFTDLRCHKGVIDQNHFGMLNGEAVPIQSKLF